MARRIALRAPLVLSVAAGLVALTSALSDASALRAYQRAPRSLRGAPDGPVVLHATVAMQLPHARVLAASGGDGVLADDDYDRLIPGAFDESGPEDASSVVFFGCAERRAPDTTIRLEPCPHLPSTLRHDEATFLGGLRDHARRSFAVLALVCAFAGPWLAATELAFARRRNGTEHLEDESLEGRLRIPVWIRMGEAAPVPAVRDADEL